MTICPPTETTRYSAQCPRCDQDCTWTSHVTKAEEGGYELCAVENDGGDCQCTREAAA
jgi:hypothetical protein